MSYAENSTTAFVSDALEQMRNADTEEQRRAIYRLIYFRVYERLNILARKTGLKPVIPEVMTQDIADATDHRLETFFAKQSNEKHWQNMQSINDLMSIAAKHMRYFMLDALRYRSKVKPVSDQQIQEELNINDWFESRLNEDPLKKKSVDPVEATTRDSVFIEFWETFNKMAETDPRSTELLDKSVILGLSNVEISQLYGVSESTIRSWIIKSRKLFLKLYGKEWPL